MVVAGISVAFARCILHPLKKFKPKAEDQVLAEIQRCGELYQGVKQVFLADGDAFSIVVSPFRKHFICYSWAFTQCWARIGLLFTAKSTQQKLELQRLHELGLSLVYVGAESGSNTILRKVNKSETFDSTLEALLKLKSGYSNLSDDY